MSLRTKVLLPFVSIGLVLLLFLYGYWMPRHVVDLKHEYQQATERHLVSVVEGLIPLLLAHQLDAVYENLDTLKQRNVNWLGIRLLDASGRTIYPLVESLPTPNNRDVHTMEQPMLFQDNDMGRLIVDVDFDEPLIDVRIRHRQLFAITCAIILLSIGAIWLLIERMISRPVTDLAQASKRLAKGDFDAPLPPAGHDEVGDLVTSFEQMRSSINGYQVELIGRNASLVKFSRAIEQSPVSIVITDREGRIEFVNPRFNEVMGCDPDELLGGDIRLVKNEDGPGPAFDEIWETVTAGKTWRGEFRSTRKNGEVFWQSVSMSPVQNETGRITHAVALLEDISDRRALEEQLRQAQKMEAVGLLTGGIAHDFNNILAAIIGFGSLIRMKLPPGDPLRPSADEILHAAERAATLTRSLLAFSRKQVVNPKPVDVNALINRMKDMMLRLISEDIEFMTILHRDPLTVLIDQGQLEQVLLNVIANARDAMPNGGTLIVETEKKLLSDMLRRKYGEAEGGPFVVISISDTGIGMDKATQERIFEPFFTTKNVGKGTGLGLSTVYGIVKQNDGQISCYSSPGKGTTFRIYFPLLPLKAEETPSVSSLELTRGTETVLVAEDDEAVLSLTRSLLEEAGYTVLTASNGEEALAKFNEQPDVIDLLMLDVIMPRKNGREVYEDVRRIRPEINVLFTSGYTAELVEQKGILNGEFSFISKPSAPNDLLRMVRVTLDKAAALRRTPS